MTSGAGSLVESVAFEAPAAVAASVRDLVENHRVYLR